LQKGKELLDRLRSLGGERANQRVPNHVLTEWYDATAAMADLALRMIGMFPDSPSAQLKLCEGVEATLITVEQRLGRYAILAAREHMDMARIDTILQVCDACQKHAHVDTNPIYELAEQILVDQREGRPVRFLDVCREPWQCIASHGINVAQIMARVVRDDAVLSRRPRDSILAALVHDVGMAAVPSEAWWHTRPVSDLERRHIEGHARRGAEWLSTVFPDAPWLVEAVADHHERPDGTGYPGGLRANQISWLPRILAVCDVYAALRSTRLHRAEQNARTALTDVLANAEAGRLDRSAAERLLTLSVYPVGTVVELADGSVAVVVAAANGNRERIAGVRPAVALLADHHGDCLPFPQHIDLAAGEGRSIVRSLTKAERQKILMGLYPEFA
jgi:HD-GYP domain-containing protein (c-di-GMP phosphodiesterase class II)